MSVLYDALRPQTRTSERLYELHRVSQRRALKIYRVALVWTPQGVNDIGNPAVFAYSRLKQTTMH